MSAVIKPCWVVKDEWGLNVLGVYTSESVANNVARSTVDNIVKNGKSQGKPFNEILAGMVEQQTLFDFGVEDGE